MTKQPIDPFDDDRAFGALLRRHDLITPPSAETLAVLENRIMAEVATHPRRSVLANLAWLPEAARHVPWWNGVSRSAGLLAVLILALGFLVGREFGTLTTENTDVAALYSSTGGTPWQSFLMTASADEADDTSGETDDASNDSQ